MSALEYDSEIEKEAIEIVKKRRGPNKQRVKIMELAKKMETEEAIKPAPIEPVKVEPVKSEPVIIEPVIKPKRERSAKQKEATEKMRQKLIDAHNNKKKLAEERNIEEDILLITFVYLYFTISGLLCKNCSNL